MAMAQSTGMDEAPLSREYLMAIEAHDKAGSAFREAQLAYRAGQLADEAFLAERAKYEAATSAFDAAFAAEAAGGSGGDPSKGSMVGSTRE